MQTFRPCELTPNIQMTTIWNQKAAFEKHEDHSPYWMVFVVESGSFHYGIGKREGIAGKGDLVLSPPETPLRRQMIRPSTFTVLYYTWTFGSEEVMDESRLNPNPTGRQSIRDKQRFASTYSYLTQLKRRNDALANLRRNFLLCDLWQQLDWEWEHQKRLSRPTPDDPLIEQAGDYLKENAFETIGLGALANSLGLSTVQFSRRFQRRYGVNPSEYVSELRLEKARTLLLENRLTLDEIAQQCGYCNGFYFSRVFSQKMGINPSEYRHVYRV